MSVVHYAKSVKTEFKASLPVASSVLISLNVLEKGNRGRINRSFRFSQNSGLIFNPVVVVTSN